MNQFADFENHKIANHKSLNLPITRSPDLPMTRSPRSHELTSRSWSARLDFWANLGRTWQLPYRAQAANALKEA